LKWKEIKSVRWKDADGMVRKFRNYRLGIFGLVLSFILFDVALAAPIAMNNPGVACGAFIFMIVICAIYLLIGFLNLVSYDVHTWRHTDEDKILGPLVGGAFFGFVPSIPIYWWLKSRERRFLQTISKNTAGKANTK